MVSSKSQTRRWELRDAKQAKDWATSAVEPPKRLE